MRIMLAALLLTLVAAGVLYGAYRVRAALNERRARKETEKQRKRFVATPVGALIDDADSRLSGARRRVGRASPVHPVLDDLVKSVRRLRDRILRDPKEGERLSSALRRRIPLICDVAERYAALSGAEQTEADRDRLAAAEGALRLAAEQLREIVQSKGGDLAFLELEVETEVLSDRLRGD